jgi:hypothetical protein
VGDEALQHASVHDSAVQVDIGIDQNFQKSWFDILSSDLLPLGDALDDATLWNSDSLDASK